MNTLEISDDDLNAVLTLLKHHYGYNFYEYSKGSLKRRIVRYLINTRLKTISDLTYELVNNENSFVDFLQNITVTVTEMFRDPVFFKALQTKVFPVLSSYPYLKIWHDTIFEHYPLPHFYRKNPLLKSLFHYKTSR